MQWLAVYSCSNGRVVGDSNVCPWLVVAPSQQHLRPLFPDGSITSCQVLQYVLIETSTVRTHCLFLWHPLCAFGTVSPFKPCLWVYTDMYAVSFHIISVCMKTLDSSWAFSIETLALILRQLFTIIEETWPLPWDVDLWPGCKASPHLRLCKLLCHALADASHSVCLLCWQCSWVWHSLGPFRCAALVHEGLLAPGGISALGHVSLALPTLSQPVSHPAVAANPWHSRGNAPHLHLKPLTQLLSGHQPGNLTWGTAQEAQGAFKAEH